MNITGLTASIILAASLSLPAAASSEKATAWESGNLPRADGLPQTFTNEKARFWHTGTLPRADAYTAVPNDAEAELWRQDGGDFSGS